MTVMYNGLEAVLKCNILTESQLI